MAKSIKGQSVNRTALANIFGVALPTVDLWIRNGLPCVTRGGRGKQWEFDTAAVADWLRDRAVTDATGETQADEAEMSRRIKRANMELSELELAKAKALVAPVDQIERMLARVFAEVRAGMRNLPSRTVSMLIGETDERRFKQVLGSEIDQVLEALASVDLLDGYDEAQSDDDSEE
ncbi:terminase small subunit [Serratia phage MQ-4]|nr:terminase small subunit [Serratia phage MQ-4]